MNKTSLCLLTAYYVLISDVNKVTMYGDSRRKHWVHPPQRDSAAAVSASDAIANSDASRRGGSSPPLSHRRYHQITNIRKYTFKRSVLPAGVTTMLALVVQTYWTLADLGSGHTALQGKAFDLTREGIKGEHLQNVLKCVSPFMRCTPPSLSSGSLRYGDFVRELRQQQLE